MALSTDAVGKTYPPVTYAIGREKVRQYARVVGESDPLHLVVEAARAAGYADVVAPPMFAVVYAAPAMGPAIFNPEVGIDFSRMVHGAQELALGTARRRRRRGDHDRPGRAHRGARGNGLLRLRVRSTDQEGRTVCVGTWTNIVRGS